MKSKNWMVAGTLLGIVGTIQLAAMAQPALPSKHDTPQPAPTPATDSPSGGEEQTPAAKTAETKGSVATKAVTSLAPTLSFYVEQGGGTRLYLVAGSTGGRFIQQGGMGSVGGIPVVGYTDRIARGESYKVQFGGRGPGFAGLTISGDPLQTLSVSLPDVRRFVVPTRPSVDGLSWTLQSPYYGWAYKLIPIGTR